MSVGLNINNNILNDVYTFNLEGNTYYFHVYYTERDDSWRVVVYDKNNNPTSDKNDVVPLLDLGKMMPDSSLTKRYRWLDAGGLFCVNMTFESSNDSVGRYNFGTGKKYQLLYLTNEEIESSQAEKWSTYKNY